jgi:hypothetical protein
MARRIIGTGHADLIVARAGRCFTRKRLALDAGGSSRSPTLAARAGWGNSTMGCYVKSSSSDQRRRLDLGMEAARAARGDYCKRRNVHQQRQRLLIAVRSHAALERGLNITFCVVGHESRRSPALCRVAAVARHQSFSASDIDRGSAQRGVPAGA